MSMDLTNTGDSWNMKVVEKIQGEIGVAIESASLVNDMVKSKETENEVFYQLLVNCREMQRRLIQLLENVLFPESCFNQMLEANDRLSSALSLYETSKLNSVSSGLGLNQPPPVVGGDVVSKKIQEPPQQPQPQQQPQHQHQEQLQHKQPVVDIFGLESAIQEVKKEEKLLDLNKLGVKSDLPSKNTITSDSSTNKTTPPVNTQKQIDDFFS